MKNRAKLYPARWVLCVAAAAVATGLSSPSVSAQESATRVQALPKLRGDTLGHFGGGAASPTTAVPTAARRERPSDSDTDSATASTASRPATIVIPLGPAEDRRPGGTTRDRRPGQDTRRSVRETDRPDVRRQLAAQSAPAGIRALRRRIVAVAEREWRFFGGAEWRLRLPSIGRAGLETQPGYRERVIHYWKRGLGRTVTNTRIGWSGAFISFVMREAGSGARFPYGGSHTWYMARTIRARLAGDRRATFHGYRLTEVAPQPGDLVCNTLTAGVTYDSVTSRAFGAHCDIVVEKYSGHIKVIGGNLTNSVRKRTLLTNPQGFLYPHQPRRIDPYVKRWLVVIRAQ